jgi:hypothetical protein
MGMKQVHGIKPDEFPGPRNGGNAPVRLGAGAQPSTYEARSGACSIPVPDSVVTSVRVRSSGVGSAVPA